MLTLLVCYKLVLLYARQTNVDKFVYIQTYMLVLLNLSNLGVLHCLWLHKIGIVYAVL